MHATVIRCETTIAPDIKEVKLQEVQLQKRYNYKINGLYLVLKINK